MLHFVVVALRFVGRRTHQEAPGCNPAEALHNVADLDLRKLAERVLAGAAGPSRPRNRRGRAKAGAAFPGACLQSPLQALVTRFLEQVNPVPATQFLGHVADLNALFDARGDEVDATFGLFRRDVENEFDLLLEITGLAYRAFRKADQDQVAGAHGATDFPIPVLAGDEVFLVEPGRHAITLQPLVEVPDEDLVLRTVAQENRERARAGSHGVRAEGRRQRLCN
jgi:hypothetical protein